MNEHTKTCCSNSPCRYRVLGAGSIGYCCDYDGYCDFQLPRDSRMQPFMTGLDYRQCLCQTSSKQQCPIHGSKRIK